MSSQPTAAEIAAGIDTTTTKGHNLRALLLTVEHGPFPYKPWDAALALGLVERIEAAWPFVLTPLGREVAELLRPRPWFVASTGIERNTYDVENPDHSWCDIDHTIRCDDEADAKRIADLLTRDDLDKAKQYRTEPTP